MEFERREVFFAPCSLSYQSSLVRYRYCEHIRASYFLIADFRSMDCLVLWLRADCISTESLHSRLLAELLSTDVTALGNMKSLYECSRTLA